MQFHSGGKAVFLRAIGGTAHIAGNDALNGTLGVIEHFRGSKAGKYFHAQGLGLFGQPAAKIAQADNVIAVVIHRSGYGKMRHLDLAGRRAQHIDLIARDRGVQGSPKLGPIG